MAKWFEPIRPEKKKVVDPDAIKRALQREMSTLLTDLWQKAATYEVAPTPTYTRTLMLKKSWSKVGPKWQGGKLVGAVVSSGGKFSVKRGRTPKGGKVAFKQKKLGKVAPYAAFVRGKKGTQTAVMAARGWKTITDIMNEEWPPARQRMQRIIARAGRKG